VIRDVAAAGTVVDSGLFQQTRLGKGKKGVREGSGDGDERELRRGVVKKELTEWRWFVVGGGCWRRVW
jgi:hypothetical protein